MIEIINKNECCGCTACKSICPKNAIEMIEDEEGFLYPKIDKEKCIHCGLCEKVCPIKNVKTRQFQQKGYLVNNKDDDIRKDSTSGGAFTPIAEYVLDKNGVVFGAAFDKDYKVVHIYVQNKNELYRLRGSKYVQSDLGDSFRKVKEFLEQGTMVCFSGTPCQIEGLKSFLGKDYDNLVTVDVMCHAVPSPLFWKKYLKFKKSKLKGEKIQKVLFRDKSKYGYKYTTMTIETEKDKYSMGVESDPYLRAFIIDDLSDRPSCYQCKFKTQYHISDFTIWDCYIIGEFEKTLDDNKGTNRVLINTEKGNMVFEKIKEKFIFKEIEPKYLVKNVKEMSNSVELNPKREEFFKELNSTDEKDFFEKWFPDTLKTKIERIGRTTLARTKIYNKIRKIVKKILRR